MEKSEFTPLKVDQLPNELACSLFKLTCEMAIPVKIKIGDTECAALNDFVAKTNSFINQVDNLQKNKLLAPDDIAVNDNEDLFFRIRQIVISQLKSTDIVKRIAAKELIYFFNPYWCISDKPIATQIGLTTELLTNYFVNPNLMAAVDVIGIEPLMTEMETANASLGTIYRPYKRAINKGEGIDTNLRSDVNQSYILFCLAIEQTINDSPNDAMLTLFKSMNELRKSHHNVPWKNKIVKECNNAIL